MLDDAAFLTSAFWDERNPAFSRADGVNYLNAGRSAKNMAQEHGQNDRDLVCEVCGDL